MFETQIMQIHKSLSCIFRKGHVYISSNRQTIKFYHSIPFVDMYQKATGISVSEELYDKFKKKLPVINTLSHDRLHCTLQILNKFNITVYDACQNIHIFSMNPITMDNYGEILKECGFIKIVPSYIIKYHTLVKSRTIANLKKEGLIRSDLNLEEVLHSYFHEWPASEKSLQNFSDTSTPILTVRMTVLEKYLNWRLSVTSEEFQKYCRNYLPLKHKPISDIQEAINIAMNDIKLNESIIKKNGFIISADPINTKLILENVSCLADLDIREAIRIEPAILKNNDNALLEIRNMLEEYRIPVEAQRRCLKVFCMCPKTVKERLIELRNLKEYQVLKSNPRVLSMVVHKKKMMARLDKIYAAKKQCYSLNHLVSSSKVFNNYINSFGNKVCGRDLAFLIGSSLQIKDLNETEVRNIVLKQLRKHKYWLHAALNVVDGNIKFLKKQFEDRVIFNNCQLLLYPITEVEQYINYLQKIRNGEMKISSFGNIQLDGTYNYLNFDQLSDDHILSIVLYEIEKKYHFSGDGIWARLDGVKMSSTVS